jgi:hypothetical protein
MTVPYTFAGATSAIPLSQLDSNFATGITLGNTTVYLGNTTTSFGNVTLTNVTISSVSTAITPAQGGTGLVTIPANNVMLGNGTSNVTVVAPGTSGNVLTSNGTTWASTAATSTSPGGSTTQVQYNNAGAFAGSANMTFDGTNLAVGGLNAPNTFGFKNRIINGAMMIDQRNAGASVTPTTNGTYFVDRFQLRLSVASKFSVGQSTVAPTGFLNSIVATSQSAYSISSTDFFFIDQRIEGSNIIDLAWGTASAKTVTLSFWAYSSLTGTFGGSISNASANYSYPFSYSIPTANTWTQISITIAGPTSGTWNTDIGNGIQVNFSLGSGSTVSGTAGSWSANAYYSSTGAVSVAGTSGATLYLTGVQLEKGSTATSFDVRPYGTELDLCQRYFEKSYAQGVVPGTTTDDGRISIIIGTSSTGYLGGFIQYKVTKRASTTPTVYAASNGTSGQIDSFIFGTSVTRVTPTIQNPIDTGFGYYFSGTLANGWAVQYTVSSEL